QGNDRGTSYRSAIFYTSEEQRRVAENTIADVEASGLWPGKVVTELSPASDFWEAEPEHQDYLERYPNGYTCHFVRPNWKLPHRATSPNASAGGGRQRHSARAADSPYDPDRGGRTPNGNERERGAPRGDGATGDARAGAGVHQDTGGDPGLLPGTGGGRGVGGGTVDLGRG